jgi:hypothetical protein
MEQIATHSVKNKIFTYFYIVFYLAVPFIIMFSSFFWGVENIDTKRSIIKYLFFFLSFPVYAVYASMILNTLAKLANKWMLLLILPHLANLIWYAFYYNFSSDWLNLMLFDSIPFYCGINLIFFGWLLILIKKGGKDAHPDFLVRLFGGILIMTPIFTPVFFFSLWGWDLALAYSPNSSLIGIFKYLFSIFMVIISHYKIVLDFYKKGKL